MSSGFAASFAGCSGFESSRYVPVVISPAVVSLPAAMMVNSRLANSVVDSRSPASSAAISRLSRSSPGFLRRLAEMRSLM